MLKLTSTPNQVPNPITYSLRYDPFNGTVEDCSNGSVKCTIQTSRTSSSHTTTVSSPIEDVVAVIDWGTLTKSMSVKLHGQSIPGGAFIASRSGGLLKSTEHVWKDESGGEFSWQKGLCFNPQKEVVAQFTPKRFHAFHTDEPATLTIDSTYEALLDHMLVTALIVEHDRQLQGSKSANIASMMVVTNNNAMANAGGSAGPTSAGF